MVEIGGYIELEHFHGKEYHENAIKLNCGRNCLAYLIEAYCIKELYIPYFLCSSVSNVCKKYDVAINYYHIDKEFTPLLAENVNKYSWIYIVNFYGQLSKKYIIQLHSVYKNIIVDNAQDFFSYPIDDIPTIYTCRKYFGVPDGAYLYSKKRINRELEQDISYNRMNFLLGRFEKTASEFYSEYSENNKFFVNEPVKKMSKLTENLLKGIDYKYVVKKRNSNFRYLNSKLKSVNKLKINFCNGFFCYPLYIDKGEELRKKMIEYNIYIPCLWPDVLQIAKIDSYESRYAKNILPIPLDQRYDREDMDNILNFINSNIC